MKNNSKYYTSVYKPNVLLIGNFLSGTGLTPQVCEVFAKKLAERGYEVLVVSKKMGQIKRLMDMVLSVLLWRQRYDIAHVDLFSGPSFFWAEAVCVLLRILGKPFILTLHGGRLPKFAKINSGRVQRLMSSAMAVTAPSGYLLKELKPWGEDIYYIPNGIELGSYSFLGRQSPKPRLVWLRAFENNYNPEMAVLVAQILGHYFPDLHLSMIGQDKDGSLGRTRQKAYESGLEARISFPGFVEKKDVPVYLNQGDIFLNTTNIDNTPVSVIEAMACGLCIVSTDVGGLPYLLKHEIDALLVPQGDAVAMAAAVRRLLTEPGLAEKLSQNARKKAESFDWSMVLPKWEALFCSDRLKR